MADVSVRPASPSDSPEVARIQIETWRTAYQTILPEQVLSSLDQDTFAAQWLATISEPPSLRHHIVIAMEGESRVGFAAFGPDADAQPDDPDPDSTAAITVLLVEPRWGRRGHGSRLLAAVADLARADGVTRLVAWVAAGDTATLQFYRGAGWESDGLRRELDTGTGTVAELRLHSSLAD